MSAGPLDTPQIDVGNAVANAPDADRTEAERRATACRLSESLDRATAAGQWKLAERLLTALEKVTAGIELVEDATRKAPTSRPGVDAPGPAVIELLKRG